MNGLKVRDVNGFVIFSVDDRMTVVLGEFTPPQYPVKGNRDVSSELSSGGRLFCLGGGYTKGTTIYWDHTGNYVGDPPTRPVPIIYGEFV